MRPGSPWIKIKVGNIEDQIVVLGLQLFEFFSCKSLCLFENLINFYNTVIEIP